MPIDFLTSAFVTLMVVIDPPGLGPMFVGLTQGMTTVDQRRVALRASIIAVSILFFFALVGEKLLLLVGIGIPAFRIAGGLLLFSIAFEMLFDQRSARQNTVAQAAVTEDHVHNIAAFPLAIPLMAGPGAITAVILLASGVRSSPMALAGLLGVILVVVMACYLVFLAAAPVSRALGVTGNIVLTRLLGVLLSALAVQFIIDGILALR